MTATLIVPKVKVHPQTSLEFSRIIYGTWRILDSKDPATFTPEAVAKRIEYCVSLGITTFDLADIYGGGAHQAEKCFGAGLRLLKPEVRSQIQLVTKVSRLALSWRLRSYDCGSVISGSRIQVIRTSMPSTMIRAKHTF